MGANEKYEAAMHGAEYTPRLSHVRAGYVRTTSGAVGLAEAEAQFTRWLETVRAEAKAEALDSLAQELVDVDMAGADEPIRAYDAAVWLRDRANQYKEAPNA